MVSTRNDEVPSPYVEKARYWFNQAYPDWKEIYNASPDQQSETICIPSSLESLTNRRYQSLDGSSADKKRASQGNYVGDEGESKFLALFRKLKLGGILLESFESEKFITKMNEAKVFDFDYKIWKEEKRHFECDALFLHRNLGCFVIEIKACENNSIAEKRFDEATKQLGKIIRGLTDIYWNITGTPFSCDFNGVVCMPNATVDFKHDKYRVLGKTEIQSINFRKFWLSTEEQCSVPRSKAPSSSDMFSFLAVIIGHRKSYYDTTPPNMQKINQVIEPKDFSKINNMKRRSVFEEVKFKLGKAEPYYLTTEQRRVLNCNEQNILISGPPGTGKTIALLLRALEAAISDRPGRVIIATKSPHYLLKKFYLLKALFRNFTKVCSSEILRREIVLNSDISCNLFRDWNYQDDIFLDDTVFGETLNRLFSIKKAVRNYRSIGTTTVVFTGQFVPNEMSIVSNFYHIELITIVRGTRSKFDKQQPCNVAQRLFFRSVSVEGNSMNIVRKNARASKSDKSMTINETDNFLTTYGAFENNRDLVCNNVEMEPLKLLVYEPRQRQLIQPVPLLNIPVEEAAKPSRPTKAVKNCDREGTELNKALNILQIILPVCSSLFGKSINLTSEQKIALSSQIQFQIICGPFGTGKTMVLMLKAYEQAKIKPNGTIFLFTRPEYVPIIKLFFIEMHQSIKIERRNANLTESLFLGNTTGMNKNRYGICIDVRGTYGMENGVYIFGNDDDVFRDDIGINETAKKFLENRTKCKGSGKTVCAFNGEIATSDGKDIRALLSQFSASDDNFEIHQLNTVMRGSAEIINFWKSVEFGQNRASTHVKEKMCSTINQVVESIGEYVNKLSKDNVPNNFIAIITQYSSETRVIREYLKKINVKWTSNIKQAELTRKAAKEIYGNPNWTDTQRTINHPYLFKKEEALEKYHVSGNVVVEDYEKVFSFEWPYVIVVTGNYSGKNNSFLLLAASRATQYLMILRYDSVNTN